MEYNSTKKSRQQINRENYQKNKARIKKYQQEKYQQQKVNQPKPTPTPNYSRASQYKILISLKDYTLLDKEKQKLWLNFIWTFKDLNASGFHDIIQIMKVREEADKLINDYWFTTKSELKQRSRSWDSLTEEQQNRLVKYWGQEKARLEKTLSHNLEKQEKEGQIFEKEIKELIGISLLHEERGRIKCKCWSCEERLKVEKEYSKQFDEPEEETEKVESDCGGCYKYKKVDPESGLCKKCERE